MALAEPSALQVALGTGRGRGSTCRGQGPSPEACGKHGCWHESGEEASSHPCWSGAPWGVPELCSDIDVLPQGPTAQHIFLSVEITEKEK